VKPLHQRVDGFHVYRVNPVNLDKIDDNQKADDE
jgi:hypothetical protein